MFDLNGVTVLITGAGGGVGIPTALALAEAGANVIGQVRGEAEQDRLQDALSTFPQDRFLVLPADLGSDRGTDALWSRALDWRGRVDVVVLNAATLLWAGIDDAEDEWDLSWSVQIDVNVRSPARLIRCALPHFRAEGGGIFVTMSSWAAQKGPTNPRQMAYAASKAGVAAVAKTVARAYARENILSYIIAPGVVDTWMSRDFAETQGGRSIVEATLTMNEWVPPEELAGLIAFLSSGAARHLTGATLDVNGASYIR